MNLQSNFKCKKQDFSNILISATSEGLRQVHDHYDAMLLCLSICHVLQAAVRRCQLLSDDADSPACQVQAIAAKDDADECWL